MIKLPKWAESYLDDNKCPACGTGLSKCEIISVGIRKSSEGKPRLCFEALCHDCGQKCSTTLVTTFDLEAEQLAGEIWAAYGGDSIVEIVDRHNATRNHSASVEFGKDCDALVSFMKDHDSFEDLMRYCGLSDREIRDP
jgi:hypothetical protein